MSSRAPLALVRQRVAMLKAAPAAPAVFGFAGHLFELRQPLSDETLQLWERRWRVRLPRDYRTFLAEVGDGGAGPGYGMFPLGRWGDSALVNQPWDEWMVSDPAAAFPLTEAWNLPDSDLVPPDMDDDAMERWFERRDARYFDPALIDGTIPIAHLGCAIWVRLVVAGEQAGQVWTDDRASDEGLQPATPSDFSQWYFGWLEECERAAGL